MFLFVCLQTAILLLRIDDIVSGTKKQAADGSGAPAPTDGAGDS